MQFTTLPLSYHDKGKESELNNRTIRHHKDSGNLEAWEGILVTTCSSIDRVESWWHSKRHLVDTCEWQGDVAERESRFEEECEKVLMQTYTQLTKVVDYLPQVLVFPLPTHPTTVAAADTPRLWTT